MVRSVLVVYPKMAIKPKEPAVSKKVVPSVAVEYAIKNKDKLMPSKTAYATKSAVSVPIENLLSPPAITNEMRRGENKTT